ncbi:hypothetical protein [Siphonobacter aquaeclarae]|uniref:Uncharacterized protein n=1 Tax=Siphonobacter aquaeclarae TaxID=563176 RepID=A0A1G9T0T5_9BACT|nr:hypothetical protein [Siphonobacter aquaeclarae]SDM41250.1 hypothetical protein SAMN04488090_3367 [Siphonobacter aquaeclarae]
MSASSSWPADMLLCEGGFNVQMGNAWFLSGSSPYKYKAWSNDLDFPAPATGWRFGFYYGPALSVKIYVNGNLVHQVILPQNDQGYAQFNYSGTTFQSGDRVYVELTAA